MRLLVGATLASFAVSILAKFLADHSLGHRIAIVGRFIGLQRTENPGIAFSITFPPLLQTLLIAGALTLVTVLAIRTVRKPSPVPSPQPPVPIAFGLILGGALGNIADRIPDGLVTDFFQVGAFPIFNVADSLITVGVGLLLLDALRVRRSGG